MILGHGILALSCPIVALIRTGVHNLMIEKMRHRLIAVTLLDCFHTSVAVKTKRWDETTENSKQATEGSARGWKCNHCDN